MKNEPKILDDGSIECPVCSSHMDVKLSLNARETQAGQEEPRPSEEGNQCNDVSNLSIEEASEEQSSISPPVCKPASWRTPEPKAGVIPEAGFIMEASSWPTLAEARHAKPSEVRVSPPQKATISISSPAQKVPSSQENSVEAPKDTNMNPPSKYRSSNRKGSYGGPNFPATENIPAPLMGVRVPSANMFNVDQSRKGNGMVGMNNFFPSLAPFPHHRGEGLAPFPHNAVVPPYGRGPPGWQQQHGRSYSDASYNHPGFVPRYDQHYIDPHNMQLPPMAPWQYHYPNIPGDMSPYMPPVFSPGYTPYYGPSGPPGGIMQGFDFPTLLAMLRSQVEYYFSKENLIRDIYLTSKMDEEGFVPVSLIASFPRVKNLTSNSTHILEALKNSSIVEVKNVKLRSREWRRRASGTSAQTPAGIESLKSFAPSSNTGVDHTREQGTSDSLAPSSDTGVDRAREQATGEPLAPSSKTGVGHARELGTSESLATSRKTGTGEPLASSSNTGVDHRREQLTWESKESGEGGFDKLSTLIESKLIAESCAAPWTGLSVNLGARSAPAVTGIDLR